VPGLGASFGRGAATTYQQDLANSDCILIMGSNMAEAHPVGFRWPMRAKEKGATLMHVDPRFTRTSALCDLYVGIRAGTDVAFLGGLIHYVLTHDKWFKEYVLAYTNAATIIQEGFQDTEDLGGLFSGYDPHGRKYDTAEGHWGYSPAGRDPTLRHPHCVMQILRRHFARYTPETVARVCGCKAEDVVRVAEFLCANSGRERTSALVYAVGWTQHTTGVQIIRTAGILQLLLGNVGRPGGGIMAMRGHASIQGSTDVPTLYDLLPGYLPQPAAEDRHENLNAYVEHEGLTTGYWANFRKFIVSLLKAWYGDAADAANDYRFAWLPRIDGNYSQLFTFDRMARGEMKGYFLFGQNPGGGGPNAKLHRAGLRNLDWLVVLDWFETESAVFWKSDPSGPPPGDIKTEVFFIPAAAGPEKDGTLTNTQRLLQWHDKALDPPDDCRSDAWFVYNLGKRLRQLYAGSTDPRDQAFLNLTWDYDFAAPPRLPDGSTSRVEGEPDVARVLQEINGWKWGEIDPRTGRPRLVSGFSELTDDGTTACGCWVYSGVFPEPGRNRARERRLTDNPLQPEWGFAWPHNRRIMYNRASADPEGRPWSEGKKLLWWDAGQRRWVGLDQPDFEPDKPPDYVPPPDATGMAAIAGTAPFIMKPDGLGWLYAPGTVKDGPLPTHYEPVESPVGNLLYPAQTSNPAARFSEGPLNPVAHAPTAEYPVVATTFRLTEHYLSGPMSRFNSWLNELQPEMFVELSPELAAERGIEPGGWVTVRTPRGQVEARALVTRRLQPLVVEGRIVHQVGLPIHWSFAGERVGATANDLTSLVSEPNVSIHEAKAFACQVSAGRLPGRPPVPTVPEAPRPTQEPVPDTPSSAQPEGRFGDDD
jgi:formate dehydrogenase major subunit